MAVRNRFDRTERLTIVLTLVFVLSLGLVRLSGSAGAWVVWGVAMVLVSGIALVLVNRSERPAE
ncbi:hypothetical protein SAMN04487967_1583 [Natronorubrum sediminis]|uniref:Uncharacterized protein n=1 Tax=Natronorubrum sediminis TaxID=640943 RepID=A0A1H6FUC6_9EURY|nr:hypothetical protein [Natronorubrum sediminis]SEH14397.1 hypothetical protein SAMN04487967_1583 [Natronorubrum sediminis]